MEMNIFLRFFFYIYLNMKTEVVERFMLYSLETSHGKFVVYSVLFIRSIVWLLYHFMLLLFCFHVYHVACAYDSVFFCFFHFFPFEYEHTVEHISETPQYLWKVFSCWCYSTVGYGWKACTTVFHFFFYTFIPIHINNVSLLIRDFRICGTNTMGSFVHKFILMIGTLENSSFFFLDIFHQFIYDEVPIHIRQIPWTGRQKVMGEHWTKWKK